MSSIGNEDYVLVRRSEVKSSEIKAVPAVSSSSSASSSSAVVLKVAAIAAPSDDAKDEKVKRPPAANLLAVPRSMSSEGKAGFSTVLNYLGVTAIASGSSGTTTNLYVGLCGEWTSCSTLFQQYRVSKVAITLDTHALTTFPGAYDSGTVSSLSGSAIGHALQPGLPPLDSSTSLGDILDVPRAKLIDYGISKNLFKLTSSTLCFDAGHGTCVPSTEWQECSQHANHIWAEYAINKYPTTLPRTVTFPIRIQFWVHFRRRR